MTAKSGIALCPAGRLSCSQSRKIASESITDQGYGHAPPNAPRPRSIPFICRSSFRAEISGARPHGISSPRTAGQTPASSHEYRNYDSRSGRNQLGRCGSCVRPESPPRCDVELAAQLERHPQSADTATCEIILFRKSLRSSARRHSRGTKSFHPAALRVES